LSVEAGVDGDLRAIFRNHLPQVAWSSIETGAVEPGVADMNGCLNGVEFWIEMKRTFFSAVDVKPSQVAWHRLRQSKGGRTFFAVRRRSDLFLISGSHAVELRREGLSGCPFLLFTDGGPSGWDWRAILAILLNRTS
jgi:hypothetical protein